VIQAATPALILASASTARRAVLEGAGLRFETRVAGVDEAAIKEAAQAAAAVTAALNPDFAFE
jgi:septum formation protein